MSSTLSNLNLLSNDQYKRSATNQPIYKQQQQEVSQNNNQWLDANLTIEQANDLQKSCIIPLSLQPPPSKRQQKSSSLAKYNCTVCNYYCHNMDSAFKHKQSLSHVKYFKVRGINLN